MKVDPNAKPLPRWRLRASRICPGYGWRSRTEYRARWTRSRGSAADAPSVLPSFLPKVQALAKDNEADPEVNCFLLGTPRVTGCPFPFKIIQSPKETVILYEAMRTFRDIPTDGRGHRPDFGRNIIWAIPWVIGKATPW